MTKLKKVKRNFTTIGTKLLKVSLKNFIKVKRNRVANPAVVLTYIDIFFAPSKFRKL